MDGGMNAPRRRGACRLSRCHCAGSAAHAAPLVATLQPQSVLLARTIATASGKPLATRALRGIRTTAQQVGLTSDQRDRNVRGAFQVASSQKAAVAGRRVLLVDDVYTTGATVKASTRALLRAGTTGVDVLVFFRVVRGSG